MRMGVVTRRAANDADVRLGLGPVVEADRTLNLDKPAVPERALERPGDEQHRRAVRARLRLLDEQQPVEQLDRVVLVEEPVVDQPRVLAAGPAMQGRSLGLLHVRMLSAMSERVNAYGWIPRHGLQWHFAPAGAGAARRKPAARSRRQSLRGPTIHKAEGFHGTHAAPQGLGRASG